MENQEKMIQCSKCGATIKESQAYCNYCGSINILGAEIDYRHKLDGIKNDLAEMGDDSEEEFKGTLKSGTKFAIIIISVVLGIILLAYGVYVISEKIHETHYDKSYNEMQEIFAELDALYEAEDYEGLAAYFSENGEGNYRIYDWKHSHFVSIYSYKKWADEDLERYKNAKDDEDKKNAKKWVSYDAVNLFHYSVREFSVNQLTEEEVTKVQAWADEVKKKMLETGMYTESQWEQIVGSYVNEDGTFPNIDELDKYLEENNLY